MKTHKVINTIYYEDEGNEIFTGVLQECVDFIDEQQGFGYEIVPMTKEEIESYPDNISELGICPNCGSKNTKDESTTDFTRCISCGWR